MMFGVFARAFFLASKEPDNNIDIYYICIVFMYVHVSNRHVGVNKFHRYMYMYMKYVSCMCISILLVPFKRQNTALFSLKLKKHSKAQ